MIKKYQNPSGGITKQYSFEPSDLKFSNGQQMYWGTDADTGQSKGIVQDKDGSFHVVYDTTTPGTYGVSKEPVAVGDLAKTQNLDNVNVDGGMNNASIIRVAEKLYGDDPEKKYDYIYRMIQNRYDLSKHPTVHGDYRSSFDRKPGEVVTGTLSNSLSPTQWIGRGFDVGESITGTRPWSDTLRRFYQGNSGIVSDNFQENHPIFSTAANFLGDIYTGGVAANATTIPTVTKAAMRSGINPRIATNYIADLFLRPYSTYNAFKDDRYVYDFGSARQNIQRLRKAIDKGTTFTNGVYKDLTGLDIPKIRSHITSEKKMGSSKMGYFSPYENTIYLPLTSWRSNIATGSKNTVATAAHEQAHAANQLLTNNFSTPPLHIWDFNKKWVGFLRPNTYYTPNPEHPIARKYQDYFNMNPYAHGRSPEEHWADYLGSKAIGRGNIGTILDDFLIEGMPAPRNFISDYKQYLRDTYTGAGQVYQ